MLNNRPSDENCCILQERWGRQRSKAEVKLSSSSDAVIQTSQAKIVCYVGKILGETCANCPKCRVESISVTTAIFYLIQERVS